MATAKKSREEELQQEIFDLKAGTAFHLHQPIDGSPGFRCSSPYCDDLGSSVPIGAPPNYQPAERYARRNST